MRDELLKILEIKLKYLNDNIEALNRMNNNLDVENEHLNYIREVLNLFEDEENKYNINNFYKLDRDNFNKIMQELDDDVIAKFGTESCNYDGLIYLINGINNGISLTLTSEQVSAVEYMIDNIVNRQMYYLARIDGILLAKSRLDIEDIDELTSIRDRYNRIVEKLENDEYVDETDEVMEAINYSRVPNEQIIDILSYLLEYNSKIYHEKRENGPKIEVKEEEPMVSEEEIDLSKPFVLPTEPVDIPITLEEPMEFNDVEFNEIENQIPKFEETEESVNETDKEIEEKLEENNQDEETNVETTENNEVKENIENQPEESFETDEELELPTEMEIDEDFKDLATEDDYEEYSPFEIPVIPPISLDTPIPFVEESTLDETEEELPVTSEPVQTEENKEVEVATEKVEEVKTQSISLNDIQTLFNENKVKYESFSEEEKELLFKGDFDNYREVFNLLNEKNLTNTFEKNPNLLTNVLVYSNREVLEKVFAVTERNLSVDSDDMKITLDILISALPSVFVKEPHGNYETFVKNVESLKEWGIDLINLFDFSREIFVMNHEQMLQNYNLTREYDLIINDRNAKYLLMLSNLAEKLDYYVEAVAVDTMKDGTGNTFDGVRFIKEYPSKLNTVNDETIKRLRYSSENGKKLFGSKENSLAGEITNLKVDVINMEDSYLRTYLNNDFDVISHDEVREYEKMINDAKEYRLNIDETLEQLEKYRNGLKYTIEGVNLSRNKVIRNYNILVKNGVDKQKALIFAACYNSVITKDEYEKVKTILNSVGGR